MTPLTRLRRWLSDRLWSSGDDPSSDAASTPDADPSSAPGAEQPAGPDAPAGSEEPTLDPTVATETRTGTTDDAVAALRDLRRSPPSDVAPDDDEPTRNDDEPTRNDDDPTRNDDDPTRNDDEPDREGQDDGPSSPR